MYPIMIYIYYSLQKWLTYISVKTKSRLKPVFLFLKRYQNDFIAFTAKITGIFKKKKKIEQNWTKQNISRKWLLQIEVQLCVPTQLTKVGFLNVLSNHRHSLKYRIKYRIFYRTGKYHKLIESLFTVNTPRYTRFKCLL